MKTKENDLDGISDARPTFGLCPLAVRLRLCPTIGCPNTISEAAGAAGGGYSDDGEGNIMLPTLQAATNDSERYQKQMRFVGVVIHELFHRAGKGHRTMARAAENALTSEERAKFPREKGDGPSSTYMSWWLNEKCKFDHRNPNEVKANVVQN